VGGFRSAHPCERGASGRSGRVRGTVLNGTYLAGPIIRRRSTAIGGWLATRR
jgi:hypothetical protein